jgi:hypothetical protein
MWCGGGILHKDCPEKENEASTPTCCNYKLIDGEKHHPSNYRGCSLDREEIRKRKTHRTPKVTTGKVFTTNYVTSGLSFAAALRRNAGHQRQPIPSQVPATSPFAGTKLSTPAPGQHQKQVSQSGLKIQIVNLLTVCCV